MMRSRLAGKPGAPPVRRLVIKPLAAPPKPPPGFEDAAWGSLSTAIDAIHDRVGLDGSNSCVGGGGPVASKNNGSDVRSKSENDSALAPSKETTHSYETLYRAVEDVCVHGKAQGLFDRLVGKLKERVDESVAKLKGTLSAGCDDETFLARFDETWTEHLQSTGMVQKIFLYLDRTFVSSRGAVHTQRTIWDVSVELFKLALVLGDTTEGGGCQTDDEKRKRAAAAAAARASGTSTTGTGVRAVHDFDACQVVTRGCLRLIKAERDGEAVDRFLLKRVSRAFVSLKIYTTKFEPDFLSHVRKHYAEEGDSLFLGGSAMSVFEYLKHAEQRLTEEAERCDACLDQRTKRGAVAVVTTELLEKHFTGCLQKGFKRAFTENRVHDLKRFYELAKRCGGGGGGGSTGVSIEGHSDSKKFTSLTRRAFADALREIGAEICSDPTRENDLVMRCLRLKSMCDFTTQNAFQNDETFVAVVRESFENFINANANAKRNRPAELLAKFIDAKMRGDKNGSGKVGVGTVSGDGPGSIPGDPSTGTSSGTEEQCLDQALMLFRHVHGKDVFEAFYKKDLAKRLLLGKSASVDSEKSMIGKLKQECGAQFTAKLEGMFKDVELSKDVNKGFELFVKGGVGGTGVTTGGTGGTGGTHGGTIRDSNEGLVGGGGSTSANSTPTTTATYVNVLTAGLWPTYPNNSTLVLPVELERAKATFTEYYLSKHGGRKLAWVNGMGTCVLKARFGTHEKELVTSACQASVLLLFNGKGSGNENTEKHVSLTCTYIALATGMEDAELRRTLQSLACGKARVLTKHPKGREIGDTDTFAVNDQFADAKFRVKINAIQQKETEAEHSETHEKVVQDRQYQIDACVVRIMKTRKSLSHQVLVAEVFSQIAFPAKPADLKKRIESLIEREYLERDRADAQTYNYLA